MLKTDVLVIGGGNAGLCAALSAQSEGCNVLVLDRGSRQELGGNSRFSGGKFRVAYRDHDEVRRIIPDLTDDEADALFDPPYTEAMFLDDMARISHYRCEPDLVEALVKDSTDTMIWMRQFGIRFIPWAGWHGFTIQVSGGGQGLVEGLTGAAVRQGIQVSYDTRALELLTLDGEVVGALVQHGREQYEVRAGAVILACGGFEASAEWRSRHLGPGWDLAPVRGTWANTGDGIRMAIDVGAQSFGHWSAAHGASYDLNAPRFGDPTSGDIYRKHCYPYSIVVNARGQRFFDEGADHRSYTYAKYGPDILEQPEAFAWEVYDNKVSYLLEETYRVRQVTKVSADSLEELAEKLVDVDPRGFLRTVQEFNQSVEQDRPFDPDRLDGRGTSGLPIPKSNWAQTIDQPPFEAYGVTCGITFTYGGIRIDTEAHVLACDGQPIPGLHASGEMVGGLFYYNYPGGAGLMAGAVFGRRAGHAAAAHARSRQELGA